MTPAALQAYLHEHIPLSRAMQVEVVSIDVDQLVLSAPLEPNINHRETVFGGSASALAILSAWSLLHTRLLAQQIECRLVIQRNTMEYSAPVQGRFTAVARLSEPQRWPQFLQLLARRGRARMAVTSILESDGQSAGTFHGEFVALSSGST